MCWVHILPREVFHVALSSYKLTDNEVLTSVKGMSSYGLLTREHKHPWLTQGTPTVKQRQAGVTLSHADWRSRQTPDGEQEEEWKVFAFDLYGQFARAWLSHGT